MPVRIQHLKEDVRTVVIPYEGDSVTVKYRPSEWTPEVEETMRAQDSSVGVLGIMTTLIKEWDVLEEDDTPVPLTIERIKSLPSSFLLHILSKVWEDMSPGEAKRNSGSG